MWSNYSDTIIFVTVITVFWIVTRGVISLKAKAFNEGYKRGRASVRYSEIVK